MKTLNQSQCRRLPDGLHRAAPSLYVSVRGGSRLWLCRYSLAGKARTMSLGSIDLMPLEDAAAAALAIRADVRLRGVDVLAQRQAQRTEQKAAIVAAQAAEPKPIKRSGKTLGDLLDVATPLEARAKGWKHGPTACVQWLAPVKRYLAPLIQRDVVQITEAALVEVLAECWVTNHLQASRALSRTVTLMGHAARLGWINENPLTLKRIQQKLPPMPKHKSQHHAALTLRAVPGLMKSLAEDGEVISDLFRFLVLSGTRCNEAAGARWSEFDLTERVWTIPGGTPASRLKRWQHGDHRVPISDGMLAILKARQNARTDASNGLVFPAPDAQPFTSQQLLALLIKQGHPRGTATVHGFRSILRGFLSDHVTGERVAKELCLHHEIRNATELSYDRGDFLRERAGMLAAWDGFCHGRVTLDAATTSAIVLPLRHAIAA